MIPVGELVSLSICLSPCLCVTLVPGTVNPHIAPSLCVGALWILMPSSLPACLFDISCPRGKSQRPTDRCRPSQDDANTVNMKLFPHHPKPPVVQGWHVPVAKTKFADVVDPTWDLTLQKVIAHIDGVSDVRRIAWTADVSLDLAKLAVRHLLHYDTVLLSRHVLLRLVLRAAAGHARLRRQRRRHGRRVCRLRLSRQRRRRRRLGLARRHRCGSRRTGSP